MDGGTDGDQLVGAEFKFRLSCFAPFHDLISLRKEKRNVDSFRNVVSEHSACYQRKPQADKR